MISARTPVATHAPRFTELPQELRHGLTRVSATVDIETLEPPQLVYGFCSSFCSGGPQVNRRTSAVLVAVGLALGTSVSDVRAQIDNDPASRLVLTAVTSDETYLYVSGVNLGPACPC